MLLPQRRLTSTWRASRPLPSRLWPVPLPPCCSPAPWRQLLRTLSLPSRTMPTLVSTLGRSCAPIAIWPANPLRWGFLRQCSRHHLQDGGWGASQVRQAPPASCWWLQGPHEHWRRNLWKRGKLYSGSRFGLPKPATRVHQLLAAGVSWGQPEQQQPVLGIRHRHHLRHRWFEGSKTSQLAPWMAGCAHPYLLHCTVA